MKSKHHHLVEAELYETEEEAEMKAEEFREKYTEKNGYVIKMEKDFLKIIKQWPNSIVRTPPF